MTSQSKKIKPNPQLERLLTAARRKIAAMTPRQLKRMSERQAESWARQDKD